MFAKLALNLFVFLFTYSYLNSHNYVIADYYDFNEATVGSERVDDSDIKTELINTLITEKPRNTISIIKNKFDEENDEEGEDNDEEGEHSYSEEVCNFKNLINNINSSQYLPDDYEILRAKKYDNNPVITFNESIARIKRLNEWRLKLQNNKDLFDTRALLSIMLYEFFSEINIASECSAALMRVANAMYNVEHWSLKFFDSIGNLIPSGLAGGRISSLGEYDECVSIVSPASNKTTIYGKYCQLKIQLPYPSLDSYRHEYENFVFDFNSKNKSANAMIVLKLLEEFDAHVLMSNIPIVKFLFEGLNTVKGQLYRLGICIPHECRSTDIENAINQIIYPILKIPVAVPELTCASKADNVKVDDFQLVSIIVFSIGIGLTILSTLFEIYIRRFRSSKAAYEPNAATQTNCQNSLERLALSFSVISNTNKLLEAPNFPAIYGIRLFVIIGYSTLMAYVFPLATMTQKLVIHEFPSTLLHSWKYFFIRTPILWIDALIVCFGLLLTHTMLGKLQRFGGAFNYGSFVCQRWLRVTVALAGSVLLTYLVPLTGDGPIWNQQWLVFQTACRSAVGLFGTLFRYNNYMFQIYNYKLEIACPVCNPPSWYFSTSFQIYIFTPLLFLTLYKWPKFGVITNILVIIAGTAVTLYPKFMYNYVNYNDFKSFRSITDVIIHVTAYYLNPLQHVANFAVGILTGYLLKTHPNIYIGGKRVEILVWIVAIAVIPIMYVWNNAFWSLTESPSEVSILIWYSIGRTLWGIAFAWFYFACSTKRGGFIETFFSMRALQPIAKLGYTIYLLQVPVLVNRIYKTRQAYILTDSKLLQDLYVDFTFTILLAYVFYLVFEKPLLNLVDMLSSKENWSEFDTDIEYDRHFDSGQQYGRNLFDQNGNRIGELSTDKKNGLIIDGNTGLSDISNTITNGANDKLTIGYQS